MHPEHIKAEIRIHGSSPAKIARDAGISDMAVSYVIHGHRKSANVASRICEITGLDPDVVWPGRYPELQSQITLHRAA